MKPEQISLYIDAARARHTKLLSALDLWKSGAVEEGRDVLFDGAAKRFERLFLSTTVLLKFALAMEGVDIESPYQSIQEATSIGWIKDRDFWLTALDARMESLQGTEEADPAELANIFSNFAAEVEVIVSLLEHLRTAK